MVARETTRLERAGMSAWVKSGQTVPGENSTLSAIVQKRTSAERFIELPKLDCFLRSGTVPIISVPLTLRCSTASAVHSAHPKTAHRRRATWLSCPF